MTCVRPLKEGADSVNFHFLNFCKLFVKYCGAPIIYFVVPATSVNAQRYGLWLYKDLAAIKTIN